MSFVSRYLDPALIERLNHLQLSARQVVEGTINGAHRSPVKGASVEFRQHRFYTPGDEPRRLDWRVLARTDRPYIKEYDEETNLRCQLVLDASGSMAYDGEAIPANDAVGVGKAAGLSTTPVAAGKFDYAARFVASLAYLMLGQTESVGLALVGESVERWLPPHAGTSQLSHVIDVLERAVPCGPAQLGQALQDVADRLGRRSLVVVASDLFAPIAHLRQGLARLRHDRHETILIQVLHPHEVLFPFSKWSQFRGLEGERPRLCEPAVARKVYLNNFRRHRQALDDTCRALGAEFYSFQTDRPLAEAVTLFLHRRAARA